MKKSTLRVLAASFALVLVAAFSSALTVMLTGSAQQTSSDGRHWITEAEYETLQRYSRLEEIRQTLTGEYYRELDDETLVLGAIRGMTDAVDDVYTFYYTPEELTRSMENSSGQYRGVGILLQANDEGEIDVVRVYPNTPAETAGVRAGDKLIAVDGIAISGEDGRTFNDAVNRIRGEEGSEVVLTVRRGEEVLELPVERGDITISYASYQLLDEDRIGYLSITQFTGDAADVTTEALAFFEERGVQGMIIDLRDDPGGYLDQVVSIANKVLPQGIIVYTMDRNGARSNYYSDAQYYDVPLVVLVNESSASASEILAGSVQALDRGVVMGTTTYGKGIVQTLKTFEEDGAAMQLTTAIYYDALDRTPNGNGVTPDILLPFDGDTLPLEPDPDNDNQLAEAISWLHRQFSGTEQ